jgi:hypothetical protein
MNLITLAQFKRYCGLNSTFTDDDALLTRLIIDGEQWAEMKMQRSAKPIIEARTFDYCDPRMLYFDDDLLEVVSITNGDATAVTLTDLYYEPRRRYPKYGIGFEIGASDVWTYSTTPENAISITAAWGYHDDWGNAWVNSLDEVEDAGGINASITTISVSNVDGANLNTDSPRFSAGMLIKIESEWCEVTAATNAVTDTLTVKRGARGSTAAIHAKDTPIYTFAPARNVVAAIMIYCHWRYNQKNNRGSAGFNVEVPQDITDLLPVPVRTP